VGGFDSRPPPQMACDLCNRFGSPASHANPGAPQLWPVLATPVLQVTAREGRRPLPTAVAEYPKASPGLTLRVAYFPR
jgi:hypothetical protein